MTDLRTPLSRVRGLGAAREGTGTFWRQRLTAMANIPLTLFGVGVVVGLTGAEYERAIRVLSHPLVAVTLALMILSAVVHMRIGMKEIIEDYVHGELAKLTLVVLSTFFAIFVGAVSVFSVLKIAFGG